MATKYRLHVAESVQVHFWYCERINSFCQRLYIAQHCWHIHEINDYQEKIHETVGNKEQDDQYLHFFSVCGCTWKWCDYWLALIERDHVFLLVHSCWCITQSHTGIRIISHYLQEDHTLVQTNHILCRTRSWFLSNFL